MRDADTPIPRWQEIGLWRDPEQMYPREREAAQLVLLERWLIRRGIDPATGVLLTSVPDRKGVGLDGQRQEG